MPDIARAVDQLLPTYRAALEGMPNLAAVVEDRRLLERHLALVDRRGRRASAFDAVEAVAEKKIREAVTVEEAMVVLTAHERGRVLARPSLLRLLATIRERAERRRAAGMLPTLSWWRTAPTHAEPRPDVSDLE